MSKFKVGDVVVRTESISYGAQNWSGWMKKRGLSFNTPAKVMFVEGEQFGLAIDGTRIGTKWYMERYERWLAPAKPLEDYM